MKTLRRVGLVVVILLVIFSVTPFLLPVSQGTIDPRTLASADGSFIDVNGVTLYVEQSGPADGEPVMLLHGLFGSTYTWRNQVPALTATGYRVIAYDRPPFGLSDKSPTLDYSPASQADQLAALLDQLGVDQALFVGHSAGGAFLVRFAVRHPDRVERMVLAAGALEAGPPPGLGTFIGLPPVMRWGEVLIPAIFTRDRLASTIAGFYADPTIMTPEAAAGYYRPFDVGNFGAGFMAVTRDSTPQVTDDDLRGFAMPVLLLWGELDRVVPLTQTDRLQALLPDSSLEVIPGAGHQPMEETPNAFNQALLDWLDG
jgi:pimeloyl-ACP methyl ester carboxylesterase